MKAKCRKNVVRKITQSVEKKKTLPKILVAARNANVSFSLGCTIDANDRQLPRKSGVSTESQETAIVEDDDPFRELQDEIDDLRSVQPNLIEEDFDATTFGDVDAEVIAVQPPPSDAEIVAELLETEGSVMMMIIIPVKLLMNQ